MATRNNTEAEAAARNAQDEISRLINEAEGLIQKAQKLADANGLSFTLTASDGGEVRYQGGEDGGYFTTDGAWYNSNC